MKLRKILKIAAFVILMICSDRAIAQNPPHPNGGFSPGSGNTVVGGQHSGAPVGNGTWILLTMAALYTVKKQKKSLTAK